MSGFKKKGRDLGGAPSSSAHQDTVISASSVLEGQFNFGGPTIIAGQLKGTIHATDLLVIERGAVIEADIVGAHVIVKGSVRGRLKASEALELTATADFQGEVSAPTLTVAEGAQFTAAMEISRNPTGAMTSASGQSVAGASAPSTASVTTVTPANAPTMSFSVPKTQSGNN